MDNDTGDYYKKISGTWTLQGNLEGPAGADGADGAQGPQGIQGPQGDTGATGATGATGPAGADGVDGADGATWYNGSGVPASGLGVDDDFYLDNDTGDYYKKIAGTWTLQGNLEGPTGPQGPQGPAGPMGTPSAMATVQVHRTSDYTLTTSYTDIDFDVKDVESDDTIIEHDDVNADRILIKADGNYLINYGLSFDVSSSGTFSAQVKINDNTVMPASNRNTEDGNDRDELSNSIVATLTAGDWISLQLKRAGGAATAKNASFNVTKLDGVKGEKGDPGTPGGTTVDIEKDDVTVISNADTINFEGNVTVTDEGNNKVTVDISGSDRETYVFNNVVSNKIYYKKCKDYATFNIAGVVPGDTVKATPTPSSGGIEDVYLSWNAVITGNDEVRIRACNESCYSINTPNNQTWTIDIWKN